MEFGPKTEPSDTRLLRNDEGLMKGNEIERRNLADANRDAIVAGSAVRIKPKHFSQRPPSYGDNVYSTGMTEDGEALTNIVDDGKYTLFLKLVDLSPFEWKGLTSIDMERKGGFILFELKLGNEVKHRVTVCDRNIEYYIIDTEGA